MPYSESQARELVIKAGLRLVSEKLIARTWGNISARISDSQFVITPSGRSYESLKKEDLVIVNIEDCSWNGDIKPSSEKGIHSSVYKIRKDVDFVIHTHQVYASAISAMGKDTSFVPCAGYGLPGTKKLKEKVSSSIKKNPSSMSFLMERHGVVCLGKDYDDAFNNVEKLEEESKALYEKTVKGRKVQNKSYPYLDDYAQIMGLKKKDSTNEEKQTIDLITDKNSKAALYCNYKKGMNVFDIILQHWVYKKKYSKIKGDN